MANAEHVAVVRKGAKAIAEWRREHPGERLDLSGAHLSGAELTRAYLSGADLRGAHLMWANLFGSNLSEANLSEANLSDARLTAANLSDAKLNGADLSQADVSWANLSGADLSQAVLGYAVLADQDLSQVTGLATVTHWSHSSIGVDTLIASFRGAGNKLTLELASFFRNAGVPEELLRQLPKIVLEIKYYDSFLCYGEPDRGLAERLAEDLRARGASCWWHPKSKTIGERMWHEISRERRRADKMIVLCSAKALVRPGVRKEIEEQIDEDPDKLMPISLDELWTQPGFLVVRDGRDLKPFLMERNWGDFSGWDSDPSRYEEALEELLKGLRREKPAD